MNFDTFQAVFFTAAFVVPGFIWSAVVSMLVARRSTEPDTKAHEYLTLSCINYGLWSWLLYPLFFNEWLKDSPFRAGALLFVIAFVSPVVLGIISGWLRQRNSIAQFLGRFGFRTIHPIPRAWDFQFSRGRQAWVVVTLKNESRLYGLFGIDSFAGDDPKDHDLYLETVFVPNEGGEWVPVEDSTGVWIASDQIAAIEFRKVHEVNDGTQ